MADRQLRRAQRRLRFWLAGFFIALALPSALLVHRALDQLQWQAFHGEQTRARALAAEIDRRLQERLSVLDGRPFEDFRFAVRETDGTLRRSPLSDPGLAQALPGVMGYFQVDARGRFTSPSLPDDRTLGRGNEAGPADAAEEAASAMRVRDVLIGNRLVSGAGPSADKGVTEIIAAAPSPQALRREPRVAPEPAQEPKRESETDAPLDGAQDVRPAPRGDSAVLSSGDSVADDLSLGMRELVQAPDSVRSQAGFDRLSSPETTLTARAAAGSLGKLSELNLSPRRAAAKAPSPSVAEDEVPEALVELKAERRKESVSAEASASQSRDQVERMAPRQRSEAIVAAESNREARVRMFEGVADAFELRLVDSGHFVLFRKIWHLGERYIQGALIDRASFIEEAVLAPYRRSGLDHTTGLVVAFDGDVLALEGATPGGRYISRPSELRGELLERFRLSAPLNGLELVLSVTELPPAPGTPVVVWTALILAFVLAGGLLLMERLGVRQLALVAQQQDFVAGVSHELKTPLTSIRMYSEMLCSGWGDDERRMTYYRYIHDESERLSRLIANVLQLARMNRDELRVNPEPIAVSELLELLRSRSATALERAGFDLTLDAGCAELAGRRVMADTDAMLQILLNLVDNALKFAADAEPREVQVGCRQDGAKRLCLLVRDFGPGVADAELKRIFRPFYRGGAATSRAVKGTGIGLALVARLVAAMAGEVKARNRNPGLEVRICLPLAGGPDDVR